MIQLSKSGRTHLQDAVPIRVGQEFSGYAASLLKAARGIERASECLKDLGIAAVPQVRESTHPEYAGKVVEKTQEDDKP